MTALAVYLLAFKRGGVSGYRLILIGIAISALLLAVNDYLLSRARIEDAQEATRWLLGSLNGRGWEDVVAARRRARRAAARDRSPLARAAARCSSSATTRRTRSACASSASRLGARRRSPSRSSSVATVAAGPIVFVALTAPQIARRLTRTRRPGARLRRR